MKTAAAVSLFLLCLSATAQADPFVVNATLVTSGVFSCNSGIPCSGEGTNSLTIGSGANTATLTFRGVNTSFEVSSAARREVPIGEFELDAPEGFVVPGPNPNRWVVRFGLNYQQTLPVPGVRHPHAPLRLFRTRLLPVAARREHARYTRRSEPVQLPGDRVHAAAVPDPDQSQPDRAVQRAGQRCARASHHGAAGHWPRWRCAGAPAPPQVERERGTGEPGNRRIVERS